MPKIYLDGSKLQPPHLGSVSYDGVTFTNNTSVSVEDSIYEKLQDHPDFIRDVGLNAIRIEESEESETVTPPEQIIIKEPLQQLPETDTTTTTHTKKIV